MNPEKDFNNVNPDIRDFSNQIEEYMNKKELNKLRIAFVEKMTILVISAFGLVAALAWDEALKGIFKYFIKDMTDLGQKIAYAITITVLAVVASILLSKLFLRNSDQK